MEGGGRRSEGREEEGRGRKGGRKGALLISGQRGLFFLKSASGESTAAIVHSYIRQPPRAYVWRHVARFYYQIGVLHVHKTVSVTNQVITTKRKIYNSKHTTE